MIAIPADFERTTVGREGARGRAWVESLPGLVDELLRRWDCAVDTGPVLHGQVGIVVPARRYDGSRAVLKVSFPHPGNIHEPDAFAVWRGRGAVALYERDDERFAMLLERAGPDTLAGLDDLDAAVTAAGRVVRRLAVPAPPGLPRLADRSDAWEQEIREHVGRLARPLPRYVTDAALATVRELGREQPDTLVHGDLNYGNVIAGAREPWLAIDPKGWVGDPAYDGITLLRGRLDTLDATLQRRVSLFADAAELDRDRVRRWAQARAVTAAHWGRLYGDPEWLIAATDGIATALVR
ncbi:aminoglycoside phosphotransferase family protein [Streptomyces sp. NBC_01669]|uniref:aminoglycoside phosphotransferase family protein n=1 Tax=Streptomyces sp. NBC_01669 TaxID=2975909 RepID=UPI0022569FF0|nr:aminoglycoside phosphotransferase family protein [Streptomyces sp. NBC_01669]MCX4533235.1 aminoglycoside phosphotransferase family protein [Streptomyces sp. NBC_01669]